MRIEFDKIVKLAEERFKDDEKVLSVILEMDCNIHNSSRIKGALLMQNLIDANFKRYD